MRSLSALKGTISVALVGSHAVDALQEELVSETLYSVQTYRRVGEIRGKPNSSAYPRIVVISAPPDPPDDIIEAARELSSKSQVILLAPGIHVDKAQRMREIGIDAVCCSLEQEGLEALMQRVEELALVSVLMPSQPKAKKEHDIRRAIDCLKQGRISSVADWAHAATMSEAPYRFYNGGVRSRNSVCLQRPRSTPHRQSMNVETSVKDNSIENGETNTAEDKAVCQSDVSYTIVGRSSLLGNT